MKSNRMAFLQSLNQYSNQSNTKEEKDKDSNYDQESPQKEDMEEDIGNLCSNFSLFHYFTSFPEIVY
jgi:hypothetical protein